MTSYYPTVDLAKGCKSAFGEVLTASTSTLLHMHWANNVNSETNLTAVVNTGAVTNTSGMAVLSTGLTAGSSATLRSKRVAAYSPGIGQDARFTLMYSPTAAGQAGAYQMAGVGDLVSGGSNLQDGYFIGFNYDRAGNTSDFCVFRAYDGSVTTVRQDSFNGDALRGTGASGININTAMDKLHVFRICYRWLGAGMVYFQIEQPTTGEFVTFHSIQYASSAALTSSKNPNFRFCSTVSNATSGGGISYSLTHASAAILMQGTQWLETGLLYSRSNTKTITTETNILTIRNDTDVFGGSGNNRAPLKVKQLSMSCDGTKNCIFRGYLNTTLGGVPSYTKIATNNSLVSFDTAGTSVTSGRNLVSYSLGKTGNETVNLDDLFLVLYPGDIFTVTATSTANNDVFVSIVWVEDQG